MLASNRPSQFVSHNPFYSATTFFALFADYTTNDIGSILFRETFDQSTLELITNDVNATGFICSHAFIVTFLNMPEYGVHGARNTFQMVLASDGNKTYGLAYYYRVDSYYAAFSGYVDLGCSLYVNYFSAYTQHDLESTGYTINPKVVMLTNEKCESHEGMERKKGGSTFTEEGVFHRIIMQIHFITFDYKIITSLERSGFCEQSNIKIEKMNFFSKKTLQVFIQRF